MPLARRTTALTALGWLVTLVLVAVACAVVATRWEAVHAAGGLPGALPTAVAVLALLLGNALLAHTWRVVVALAGPSLPFRTAAWVWSVSQLARYAVGAAQVGGRAVAGRRYGVSPAAAAATTLVEIGWQLSLMAGLVLVTLPSWLRVSEGLSWLAGLAALPVVILAAGLAAPQRLVDLLIHLGRVPLLRALTRGRLADTTVTLSRRDAASITLLYVVNMALRVVAFLAVFGALGGQLRDSALAATGAYAVGQLVGWLAVFAPGGLGPREGASALVLTPLVGAGPAVVMVAVVRLLEVAAELVFLGVARVLRPASPSSSARAAADRSAP